MTSRLRTLAAATTASILLLGVAACGGDDSTPTATVSTTAAPATDPPAAAEGDLTQASFFQAITDAQTDVRTSHVSMQIGAGGQTIKAEGDVEVGKSAADTSMSMTMDMGAAGMGDLEMRLVDESFFINLGDTTGGKFAKVDLNDPNDPIAQQFGSITEQLDPSKQLDQFKTAVTSFQKAGDPETIDGVSAQPYEIVLDTSKIASFEDLPEGSEASIPKTLTYTMYVGPDNLLRRVTADVVGSTIRVDYTKWGEPVEIKAPAAGQISDTDLSNLGG